MSIFLWNFLTKNLHYLHGLCESKSSQDLTTGLLPHTNFEETICLKTIIPIFMFWRPNCFQISKLSFSLEFIFLPSFPNLGSSLQCICVTCWLTGGHGNHVQTSLPSLLSLQTKGRGRVWRKKIGCRELMAEMDILSRIKKVNKSYYFQ